MGKFGLVDAICQIESKQFCPGAEHLKVKKPVYVREMGIHLHSTAIVIHPCSCFHFIVNKISRNKTKTCTRRLTAVDVRRTMSLFDVQALSVLEIYIYSDQEGKKTVTNC